MATAPKAAKRPEKTEAFSKSLHIALSIFDDQITTLSDVRKTAYENFIVAYQTAFADIWPKIEGADIKIILKSVKDKELHELRSMADKLSPPEDQPELVQEKREVPTSDAILGNLISRIPEQHPPSKEACNLISTAFQELAEAHTHYAAAGHNLSEVAKLVSPEHLTIILAAAVQPNLQLVLPRAKLHHFLPPRPLKRQVRRKEKNSYIFAKPPSFLTPHTPYFKRLKKEHQPEYWRPRFTAPWNDTFSMKQLRAMM